MLMAHSLQKRPLQAKLLSPKAPDRRSAAERSEVRSEAVESQFQAARPSMKSSPSQGLHSTSSFPFSLHPPTKFQEYPSKEKQPLYRHSDLPPEVQGVCLSRLAIGRTQWISERAALDDPQALRYSLIDLFPIIW